MAMIPKSMHPYPEGEERSWPQPDSGDSPGAGGFGYDRTPPAPPDKAEMAKMGKEGRADLSNTGWALMAMRYTQDVEDTKVVRERRVDVDWAAVLKYIEKLQDHDKDDPENYGSSVTK